MDSIASQITSLTIVYPSVYSSVDQRKHQSSASLAFVWGILYTKTVFFSRREVWFLNGRNSLNRWQFEHIDWIVLVLTDNSSPLYSNILCTNFPSRTINCCVSSKGIHIFDCRLEMQFWTSPKILNALRIWIAFDPFDLILYQFKLLRKSPVMGFGIGSCNG